MGRPIGDTEASLADSRAAIGEITARARERFDSVEDGTLGVEEEFALLDPGTLDLTPAYARMREHADASGRGEIMTGELIASEAEFRTGICADLRDAAQQVRDRRQAAVEWANGAGVRLGATGTHPWSDYRDQVIVDEPYYTHLVEELGYVARRNNTFGLHVHCAIRGADRAIAVFDVMRTYLPVLLSLSASSPYMDGQDSGLQSARSLSFSRTFPRANIPPAFGDFAAYEALVGDLARTGSIDTYGQLWWALRPHGQHGTVEVRAFDAQPDAARTLALVGFTQGLVLAVADMVDEGTAPAVVPTHLVDENMWRAVRRGLGGGFIDWHADTARVDSVADTVRRLLDLVSEASDRRGLGIDWALAGVEAILDEGSACDLQRARAAELGVAAMYRELVEITETSSDSLRDLAGVRPAR